MKTLEAVKKQSETIDSIQKNYEKQQQIREERLEKILFEYHKPERQQDKYKGRQHSVQKLICVATWIAAIGAWVYAGIATKQWQTAKDTLLIQNRPWLSISQLKLTDETVHANATSFEKSWDFDIAFSNSGNSPARRIVMSAEGIQETTLYIDNVRDWRKLRNCADIKEQSLNNRGQSTTIVFPKMADVPTEPQSVSIDNTINRVQRAPDIVACVAYQGAGGEIHRTQILYKPIMSKEAIPVPDVPKYHYFPVIRYEISDTDAD